MSDRLCVTEYVNETGLLHKTTHFPLKKNQDSCTVWLPYLSFLSWHYQSYQMKFICPITIGVYGDKREDGKAKGNSCEEEC